MTELIKYFNFNLSIVTRNMCKNYAGTLEQNTYTVKSVNERSRFWDRSVPYVLFKINSEKYWEPLLWSHHRNEFHSYQAADRFHLCEAVQLAYWRSVVLLRYMPDDDISPSLQKGFPTTWHTVSGENILKN